MVALLEERESMLWGRGETEESRELAWVGEEWFDTDTRLLSKEPLGDSTRIVSS